MTHDRPEPRESIRELVFGLEDGLVSTLGAIIGIAAGTGDRRIIILSGFVIVVVEAFSMAAGSYLSSKSHRELLQRKIAEEREEIETKPEEEREELAAMYRERGFDDAEVAILVRRITSDKRLWLEEMIAKELRIGLGELEMPASNAAVMWTAYTVGGFVPVIPFLLLPIPAAIAVSVLCTGIGLFALGFWKAKTTGGKPLAGGAEMLIVSAAASVAGYAIGTVLGSLTGIRLR